MAPIDLPGDCKCATLCPGYDDCACVYVYEDDHCQCHCEDIDSPQTQEQFARFDATINLDIRGASLGKVASLLARVADADLYVPAHRIEEQNNILLEAVPLHAAITQLGLLAVPRSAGRPARPA